MTNAETNDKAATAAEQATHVALNEASLEESGQPEEGRAESQERRQDARCQEGCQRAALAKPEGPRGSALEQEGGSNRNDEAREERDAVQSRL